MLKLYADPSGNGPSSGISSPLAESLLRLRFANAGEQ